MKKKTLWLLGGTAAGGLICWRYMNKRAPKQAGLSGFFGVSLDEFMAVYVPANNRIEALAKQVQTLPENLRLTHQAVLSRIAASDLQNAYNYSQKKDYGSALIWAKAAAANLGRIAPLIAADVANPGASAPIIAKRIEAVVVAQKANEADRKLAEEGVVAYVTTKIGEGAGNIVGGAAKGATSLVTGFLKKIPWWVYVLGVGGTGIYFFGPLLMTKLVARIARPKPRPAPEPAPVPVQVNPRRKRSKRRR